MRVAVDLTPLPARPSDDARLLALDLVGAVARLNPAWDFHLLTSPSNHATAGTIEGRNVRRFCVSSGATPSAAPWLSRAACLLRRLALPLRRRPPSPLPLPLPPALGADLLFCPLTASSHHDPTVPTVSVLHDFLYLAYPDFLSPQERAEREGAFREAVRVASRLVCVSEHVRQTALQQAGMGPERLRTILVGATERRPPLRWGATSRVLRRYGLSRERFLLYPSSLERHHNHEMLLAAFGTYRARHPATGLRLVLTGGAPGDIREARDAANRMGLGSHVVLTGDLRATEQAALLGACAAVIFPSLYEELGAALLEAMACGKSVLCSDGMSLREVVGDAGILFDPRKPEEIVGALERWELGGLELAQGRERAQSRGGLERMAREYANLFQEALEDRAPRQDSLHGAHSDGWTGGRVIVTFRPSPSPRTLHLTLAPPPVALPGRSKVCVVVNGRADASVDLAPCEPFEARRPLPREGGHVEILIEPTFRPSEHGLGPDTRSLGRPCTQCRLTDAGSSTDLLQGAA